VLLLVKKNQISNWIVATRISILLIRVIRAIRV